MRKRCGALVPLWRPAVAVAIGALAFFVAGAAGAVRSQVSCGDTITRDTKLESDLIDCPGDGIIIGADNITLDLNGHMIDGNGTGCCASSGVWNGEPFTAEGHDEVTIKGGTIRQFYAGLTVGGRNNLVRRITASDNGQGMIVAAPDNVLELNHASGNRGGGISVCCFGKNLIHNNSISGNAFGLAVGELSGVEGLGDTVLEHNAIFDNSVIGLSLSDIFSGSTRVVNNRLAGNPLGIVLGEASGVQIERNSVSDSSFVALSIGDSSDNRIARNALSHNGQGIDLQTGSRNNHIASNAILDNSGSGITLATFVSDNDSNELIDNVVSRNGQDGIFIGSENSGNLVLGNVTHRNGDDGIDVDDPMNTLTRNIANRNGDLGIEAAPGVIDGGGNRARGNGNPLQCVNVACS